MNHEKDASGSTWKEWITNNHVPICVHALWVPYFSSLGEMSGHFYCPNPSACNCFSNGKDFLNWILQNPNLHDFVPSFHMHWGLYLQAIYRAEDAHGTSDLYPLLVHREEEQAYIPCYIYAPWHFYPLYLWGMSHRKHSVHNPQVKISWKIAMHCSPIVT